MSSHAPQKMKKQAFRALNQDGLMEIQAGVTFFICSSFITNPHLIVPAFIAVFVLVPGLRWLQRRYTYPRVGYAKLPEEDPGRQGRVMLVLVLVVFTVYVLTLVGFGVVSDVTYWRRWAPALAGAICCFPFLFPAGRSGFARYYLYILASLAGGVVFSLISFERPYENVQMFILTLAILLLTSGALIFARFLHTHPLPVAEGTNEHA